MQCSAPVEQMLRNNSCKDELGEPNIDILIKFRKNVKTLHNIARAKATTSCPNMNKIRDIGRLVIDAGLGDEN